MEDAILSEIDADVELIRGGGGVYDVTVDGELLYSKHETGRFPEEVEILDKLRSVAAG